MFTDGRAEGRTDARLIAISPEPVDREIKMLEKSNREARQYAIPSVCHLKAHIHKYIKIVLQKQCIMKRNK